MPASKELIVGGKRTELVTAEVAQGVLKRFQEEIAAAERDGVVIDKVDLSCRQWSVDAVEVMRPVLESVAPTIRYLNLNDTIAGLLTEDGLAVMAKFAECFDKATNVQAISFDQNAMGPRVVELIKSLLQAPKLEEMRLNNCGLSAETIPTLNEALMIDVGGDGKLGMGRLKVLTMDQNMIGVEGARQLGLLLPVCQNLQMLSYSGCRPLHDGTQLLSTGLRAMAENYPNHKLTVLKMEDCTFRSGEEEDDAIHDLTKAVEKLSYISHLNLTDADIGETGMGMLSQALMNAKCKLVHLNLGACSLGPEGAESLRELITSNLATLKVLKLEMNYMENDGIRTVLAAFSDDNNEVTQLWLDGNDLNEDVVDAILSCSLPKLRLLSLLENPDLEDLEEDKKDSIRVKFPGAKIYFADEHEEGDKPNEQEDAEVDDLASALAGLQT